MDIKDFWNDINEFIMKIIEENPQFRSDLVPHTACIEFLSKKEKWKQNLDEASQFYQALHLDEVFVKKVTKKELHDEGLIKNVELI